MKTIERLKQLLGKCKFGTTKVERTDGDMEVGFPDRFDVIAENGDAVATMYLREQSRCEDGAALLSESHHPHPATLDGAAAALPEGWTWLRRDFEWQGFEPNAPGREPVRVPDHGRGHEMADLYALALACRRAMEEKR